MKKSKHFIIVAISIINILMILINAKLNFIPFLTKDFIVANGLSIATLSMFFLLWAIVIISEGVLLYRNRKEKIKGYYGFLAISALSTMTYLGGIFVFVIYLFLRTGKFPPQR